MGRKKVLITGGTAFVSRFAARYFAGQGYDVYEELGFGAQLILLTPIEETLKYIREGNGELFVATDNRLTV